jgi:hypothetical protein
MAHVKCLDLTAERAGPTSIGDIAPSGAKRRDTAP